jgi:hypothetical protein
VRKQVAFPEPSFAFFAAFLVVNAGIAVLLVRYSTLALAHLVVCVGVGSLFAMMGRYAYVAAVAAYIAGSEVAYRMVEAPAPYEAGKYAVTILFIFTILLMKRSKPHLLAISYFGLLLPSISMTLMAVGLTGSRMLLTSSLAGPLSLMASIWFFSNIKIKREELGVILGAYLAGALIPAVVALFGIVTTQEPIIFNGESNPLMSGGFGPNQVSAILGLASFLGFYAFLDTSRSARLKALLIALVVLSTAQCVLTFSRGGLYNAVGASVVACCFFIRIPRIRHNIVVAACALAVILGVVVLPRLNEFTGGMLANRFENTDPTNRDVILLSHLGLWMQNFVFGVGPGVTGELENISTPHTEYVRLVAEHGLFGLCALVLLIVMVCGNYLRSRGTRQKALSASMVTWALLFMANAGMRLVAPSLTFGLGFATLAADALPLTQRRRVAAGASKNALPSSLHQRSPNG